MSSEEKFIYPRPKNVEQHRRLCEELNKLYERKNADYGNSFHDTYLEEGLAMSRIRLSDKLARFKKLSHICDKDRQVRDESIRDTLIDLANYALMTVMELDIQKAPSCTYVEDASNCDPHFFLSSLHKEDISDGNTPKHIDH